MNNNMQKSKTSKWLSIAIGVFTLAFIGFLLFCVGIDVDVNKEGLVAKAPMVTTTKATYGDMENVELIKDIDLGRRTNGLGDFIVQAGHFKNDRYGAYMLYSYTKCKSYVDITLKDGTHVVVNGKSDQETKALYEEITKHMP